MEVLTPAWLAGQVGSPRHRAWSRPPVPVRLLAGGMRRFQADTPFSSPQEVVSSLILEVSGLRNQTISAGCLIKVRHLVRRNPNAGL